MRHAQQVCTMYIIAVGSAAASLRTPRHGRVARVHYVVVPVTSRIFLYLLITFGFLAYGKPYKKIRAIAIVRRAPRNVIRRSRMARNVLEKYSNK